VLNKSVLHKDDQHLYTGTVMSFAVWVAIHVSASRAVSVTSPPRVNPPRVRRDHPKVVDGRWSHWEIQRLLSRIQRS